MTLVTRSKTESTISAACFVSIRTKILHNSSESSSHAFHKMAPTDDNSTKVYCTVPNLTEEAVYDLVRNDEDGTSGYPNDMYSIKLMPEKTPLQIFQYQYDNYRDPDYSEQWYFVIVDKADAVKEGALLCNLHPEHGYQEAVRQMPSEASSAAMALGVASLDWTAVREDAFLHAEPRLPRLALYDSRGNGDKKDFLKIAELVDFGVHYEEEDPEADVEPPPTPEGLDDLFRYTALEVQGHQSTDEVCKQHKQHATEKKLDQNRLAVADDKFDEEGLLLVQVEPRKEFRCKPPVAGELLWWNEIGFMGWDDIEKYATEHPDSAHKKSEERMKHAVTSVAGGDGGEEPCEDDHEQARDANAAEGSDDKRFKYYRTQSGMVIASMETIELPSTFSRERQASERDGDGELGPIEDTMVEELPWDYYLKKKAEEE